MSPRLASPSRRRSASGSSATDQYRACRVRRSGLRGLPRSGEPAYQPHRCRNAAAGDRARQRPGIELGRAAGYAPSADVRRDITPGGPGLPPVRHRTPAGGRPRHTDGRHRGPVTSLGALPVHRHRDPFRCHRVRQCAAARADPAERARAPRPGHQPSLRHGHGRHRRGLLRDLRPALPHFAWFLAHRSRLGCRLHRRGVPRLAAPDAGRSVPLRQAPLRQTPLFHQRGSQPGALAVPTGLAGQHSWACSPWPSTPPSHGCPAF